MAANVFNFDNTYLSLPGKFFTKVNPTVVPHPEMVLFNHNLCRELGLSSLSRQEWSTVLSGNQVPKNTTPFAQAYAGHQFGYFTMLGDGRAIVLGEHMNPLGKRYDIQLKGCGQTPYSRRGDGKATLNSMSREYIMSEAMYYLGIPTSRSLAVVKTGEDVYRETTHQGAVLTRVMTSHIRVGTFEFARYSGSKKDLQELLIYTIRRHFPAIMEAENPAYAMLQEVMSRQIDLVVHWTRVGFIHGVMNTDNTSIPGETFDYGPCSFMNTYDPGTVFSSIDTGGRYAFGNQPAIIKWNISKLAEAILPLLHPNEKKAIEMANGILNMFNSEFLDKWYAMMCSKIGIVNPTGDDKRIVNDLLRVMRDYRLDFTNTFTSLRHSHSTIEGLFQPVNVLNPWMENWTRRIENNKGGIAAALAIMEKSNPVFIPRNYHVEEALVMAEMNDFSSFNQLLDVLKSPYTYNQDTHQFLTIPGGFDDSYHTYCGT